MLRQFRHGKLFLLSSSTICPCVSWAESRDLSRLKSACKLNGTTIPSKLLVMTTQQRSKIRNSISLVFSIQVWLLIFLWGHIICSTNNLIRKQDDSTFIALFGYRIWKFNWGKQGNTHLFVYVLSVSILFFFLFLKLKMSSCPLNL